ncbi:hypothetical protein [Sphingobacterium humi]|uniref:Uncharacterized protein n=1 Tax=Sphingobacterium humi TaxID=1796905 RepID=A0A6N8L4I9_9SPHI|nr:hypothetical protein [Sphingobacterium humi]MVZ64024.1 hypothetical protein [Sphingobacterium humi]
MTELGADFYAAGATTIGLYFHATFWKNGKIEKQFGPKTNGALVQAHGQDLYYFVSSYFGLKENVNDYRIYKNGTELYNLPLKGFVWNDVYKSMGFMEGADCYVLAALDHAVYDRTLRIWKNGKVLLDVDRGSYTVEGFYVKNCDVYTMGLDNVGKEFTPVLFKNKERLPLDLLNAKTARVGGVYVQ